MHCLTVRLASSEPVCKLPPNSITDKPKAHIDTQVPVAFVQSLAPQLQIGQQDKLPKHRFLQDILQPGSCCTQVTTCHISMQGVICNAAYVHTAGAHKEAANVLMLRQRGGCMFCLGMPALQNVMHCVSEQDEPCHLSGRLKQPPALHGAPLRSPPPPPTSRGILYVLGGGDNPLLTGQAKALEPRHQRTEALVAASTHTHCIQSTTETQLGQLPKCTSCDALWQTGAAFSLKSAIQLDLTVSQTTSPNKSHKIPPGGCTTVVVATTICVV